jgi:putative endonuclease
VPQFLDTPHGAHSPVVRHGIRPDLYFEMFFIYILKSENKGAYYIGSCKNVDERLRSHNKGLVRSTKRYAPWQLVYSESFEHLHSARRREFQIKSWKSRMAIERLIKNISK